jgi:hypothetical protein
MQAAGGGGNGSNSSKSYSLNDQSPSAMADSFIVVLTLVFIILSSHLPLIEQSFIIILQCQGLIKVQKEFP